MRANGLWCELCHEPNDRYGGYVEFCRDCAQLVVQFSQKLAIGSHRSVDETKSMVQDLIREVQDGVPGSVPNAG